METLSCLLTCSIVVLHVIAMVKLMVTMTLTLTMTMTMMFDENATCNQSHNSIPLIRRFGVGFSGRCGSAFTVPFSEGGPYLQIE